MLKLGSVFSGIGGLELGLERVLSCLVCWQVEIDPFCRDVLARHWPKATRYLDVRTVGKTNLAPVDIICGGFPCQDVSSAGKRKGLTGERSGLWFAFARIVDECKPRFVVVENVASGKRLWLPAVRGDLEALGYRTAAYAISAACVGAPHLRRRLFVIADLDAKSESTLSVHAEMASTSTSLQLAANINSHSKRSRRSRGTAACIAERRSDESAGETASKRQSYWQVETQPTLVRMVHGVPGGVDRRRISALGNAVVPQCAEVVGRILKDIL